MNQWLESLNFYRHKYIDVSLQGDAKVRYRFQKLTTTKL